MSPDSPQKQATKVTLVGMVLDVALGVTKIIGGSVTQSFALVTDGIHSLTDAVTDIFVLIVARVAHSAPDENHPYGHGRFETLGTIAMGVVFFATAAVLLYDSYNRLSTIESLPIPAPAGLAIAVISIASKEWIFHYTMRVAQRINSNLLKANAWHSRSDAISSVAVLIGLLAAQQGYVWMDTVAGVFVSLIIAKVGWELCSDALKELVDTAVPDARREQIERTILGVEGIHEIASLRSRSSGGKIILELRLIVSPRISVSEGHQLGETVSRTLTGNFSDIGDVTVHIDPEQHQHLEDSEDARSALPQREEVIAAIKSAWHELISDQHIESIVLHYFERGVEVELTLTEDSKAAADTLGLERALQNLDYIVRLRIYSKLSDSQLGRPLS